MRGGMFRFSKGRLTRRTQLCRSADTQHPEGYSGFFHASASGEVFVVWCKRAEAAGDTLAIGTYLTPVATPSAQPIRILDEPVAFTNSKPRLGAEPSDTVDVCWVRDENEIMHGMFDLKEYL